MIDRLIELVRVDVFEVLIILFFGLITGVLFSGISWKGKVTKRDGTIRGLEASIKEKDVDIEKLHLAQEILKKQYAEIESLNRRIEENKRDRIRLSQQINEKVTDLERDFKTQLDNKEQDIRTLNDQVNEKNESIDLLKNNVANLEEVNQESVNLTEQLATNLSEVKGQLENREQNIRTLNDLVNEMNESLDLLKYKITNLEEMNRESAHLAEQLTANLEEYEVSVEEKSKEISSMSARMSKMHDDLTHIVGIGPKVSSVLRGAGIGSFKKLGSSDLVSLTEILEAENPNLLRLVDPSTWPEQARLASGEDWDALSTLQESLKGSRRSRQQLVQASPM